MEATSMENWRDQADLMPADLGSICYRYNKNHNKIFIYYKAEQTPRVIARARSQGRWQAAGHQFKSVTELLAWARKNVGLLI